MKTMKIPTEIKEMLDEFGDGRTTNRTMEKLLEDVDAPSEPVEDRGMKNIRIDDELHYKLVLCRMYKTETFGSVIYRLLQQKHQK